ncbi:lytic murein transglycosylase [Agrobacterium pusense]|nr:lytic murein transglycosylase [Agrobacterium pusense]
MRFTPLCPAGHLPHKWGDRLVVRPRHFSSVEMERRRRVMPISLLVGEMPGRAEGGILAHHNTLAILSSLNQSKARH